MYVTQVTGGTRSVFRFALGSVGPILRPGPEERPPKAAEYLSCRPFSCAVRCRVNYCFVLLPKEDK
jgi:hypothetical protein